MVSKRNHSFARANEIARMIALYGICVVLIYRLTKTRANAFADERKNGVAVDGTNDNKISILTNIRPPKNSQNSAQRPTTTPHAIYTRRTDDQWLAQTLPPLWKVTVVPYFIVRSSCACVYVSVSIQRNSSACAKRAALCVRRYARRGHVRYHVRGRLIFQSA